MLEPMPPNDEGKPIAADLPEELMVVDEIEMPISGQAILWMGVGLLAMGGVVGIEEGRELAGLSPLSEAEHNEMLAVAKWMKSTGCQMPLSMYRFLFEAIK